MPGHHELRERELPVARDPTLPTGRGLAEPPAPRYNTDDLSGSLVQATSGLTGIQCIDQPEGTAACDHIEESVFPAETLGQHYVVTVPTSPNGNVDGTTLTYNPTKPAGCPTTINAGQVVDCGQVKSDFEIKGSNEFGVFSGMLGVSLVDPANGEGDPAESFALERLRRSALQARRGQRGRARPLLVRPRRHPGHGLRQLHELPVSGRLGPHRDRAAAGEVAERRRDVRRWVGLVGN